MGAGTWGQGGQPPTLELPTLEKIRMGMVGHAHPENIKRGLKPFTQ